MMKTNTKRISAGGLLLLLLAMQTACGETSQNLPQNTGTSAETAAQPELTTEDDNRLKADVPEKDFGNTSFDILTASNWDNDWTEIYEFTAEEQNADPINDAVWLRNTAIEDRFHVKIHEINQMGSDKGGTGKGSKFIETSVMAGDNAYDASLMGAYDVSALAYNNYLLDLFEDVPYLDLSKPWWDQKANSDLAMKGKMFYTTGDISTIDNDCTFCILFNKKMINDNDLENPYDLVRSGKWTIDKFIEMASASISRDLNGDMKYDESDQYGFCIWIDSMMGIINAAGEKFCTINDNGDLELTLNNERTETMLTKYMELAFDRQRTFSIYHISDSIETMFANDQVLFYTRYLCIIKKYRSMETDFGILPYPKYDEQQDTYYSTVAPYGCSFICVPSVVEDLDMTGIILEAMAAESMYTVTPAYYDITLEGKTLRDEESSEMLDLILANRVFDLGLFYEVGGLNEKVMDLFRNSKNGFVSMVERNTAKAQAKLDEINAAFDSMGN